MPSFTFNPDYWLIPDWPAPANIRAGTTLRNGGVSLPPYDSLNLGDHVGDDPAAVAENRQRLKLPGEPIWLKQTHSTRIVNAAHCTPGQSEADGSYTTQPHIICTVLTADCLPLLICNKKGTQVAAVHAGWRGLAAGIIETAVKNFTDDYSELLVWLGPAIGPNHYEVGNDVREVFITREPAANTAFVPTGIGRGNGIWTSTALPGNVCRHWALTLSTVETTAATGNRNNFILTAGMASQVAWPA